MAKNSAKKPQYKSREDLAKEKLDRAKRAAHVRRDDKAPTFKLGLMEIDEAIKYYFDHVIKPQVQEQDRTYQVPVIYGSPERWKSIQRDGYYRDEKGKMQVPLIMFKRNSITNRRDLARNLDANNPLIYQDFYTRYSPRNRYGNFSRLVAEIPEKEIHNIIIPNYVTLTYDAIIWTDYIQHMNKLVEAINFSDSAFWGEPDKFKFYTVINNFSTPVELTEGEDRLIRSSFELTLNGYIVPDSIQKELAQKSQRGISVSKVVFDIDADWMAAMATGSEDPTQKQFTSFRDFGGSTRTGGTYGTHINQDIINYLSLNNAEVADTITADTATFDDASFATAPPGIPATGLDDFYVLINGVQLPDIHITSFQEVGADVVMVINTGSYGTELQVTDEIVAIGKFA